MIYQAFQAHADVMVGLRRAADLTAIVLGRPVPPMPDLPHARQASAMLEVFAGADLSYKRPPFGIPSVRVGNRDAEVTEEAAHVTPFATLLHFKKDVATEQPKVLVVAPMSGHFATLLRGTVRTLLPENDVYITDWHNARDVPLRAGTFDFDDFVDHIIKFIEVIGPRTHIVAVCQPCVAVLAAVALMADGDHPMQPRTMTLMAGPIDTRLNPTKVNDLAMARPIEWFEDKLIGRVPLRYPGAMRRVYPGFMQLTAFMSMNLNRHVQAHIDLYDLLVKQDSAKAASIKSFYDEYFAVMDLPAEFYLQTVRIAFQEHLLPLGRLKSRGRPVRPSSIRRTHLLTVEGERDDICGIGQTLAAQDLCTNLSPYRKRHHMQAGVGHYGVFSGRKWESGIYPMVKHIIHSND